MKTVKRTVTTTFVLLLCALSQASAADPETEDTAKTSTAKTFMPGDFSSNESEADSSADANGVYWVAGCECSNDFNWITGQVSVCAGPNAGGPVLDIQLNAACSNFCSSYGMWLTQWAFLGTTGSCQF